MDLRLLILLPIAFLISATLVSIIKLYEYGVSSMLFYFITPLFPVIILTFNLLIVFDKHKEIRKVSAAKKIFFTLNITIRRLPLYLELMCHAASQTELEQRMIKERYVYFEERFSGIARLTI